MAPFALTIFLMGLSLGTTITFSSSHWLPAWMGIELNTLAIIPLMAQLHHPRAVEATTKYFLIQAAAATTLLFASMTNAWLTGQWDILQLSHPTSATIATLALALKIGLAPLHAWLPEILQGLDLTTGLILSTWQKLAPFILLLQIQPADSSTFILLGLASTVLGGWGGLNQTQLRKVLAYSSTAHLGWMMLVLQFSHSLALLSLITYLIMTTSLFLVLKLNSVTDINTLAMSWAKSPIATTLVPLILLSLGGLPPLTGFMPKWLILVELTKQNLPMTALLAALSALLSLYFYLRLAYAMTLTMSPNNTSGMISWRTPSTQNTLLLATVISCTIWLLPVTPTVLILLLF